MIEWKTVTFDQLTNHELYQLLKLRVDVFVVEQTCPYPELDNKDLLPDVTHLLGWSFGELVACARILGPGISYENASIGRVATKQQYRGNGMGHQLMNVAVETCQSIWPEHDIEISAQHHLQAYYESHGFEAISDPYLEDDIPHIHMKRAHKVD